MKTPTMGPREFSDFCAREIERGKFYEAAKEFADTLLMREKEVEQATRLRDAAVAEREKVLAEIEGARVKAAQEAAKARADARTMLDRDQVEAVAAKKRAAADLEQLLAKAEQARVALTAAEDQRDKFLAVTAREMADLTQRRDALRGELAALKERFAALSR